MASKKCVRSTPIQQNSYVLCLCGLTCQPACRLSFRLASPSPAYCPAGSSFYVYECVCVRWRGFSVPLVVCVSSIYLLERTKTNDIRACTQRLSTCPVIKLDTSESVHPSGRSSVAVVLSARRAFDVRMKQGTGASTKQQRGQVVNGKQERTKSMCRTARSVQCIPSRKGMHIHAALQRQRQHCRGRTSSSNSITSKSTSTRTEEMRTHTHKHGQQGRDLFYGVGLCPVLRDAARKLRGDAEEGCTSDARKMHEDA